MNKIYLAAMYGRRPEMELIADYLKSKGYEITARWVYGAEEATGISREEIAILDLDDVDAADTVVSFTHPRGTKTPGGGRHVEFGYGIARQKKMILIGERENVFHHFPGVLQFDTLEDYLEYNRTREVA